MGAFSTLAGIGVDAAMSRSKSSNQNAAIEAEAERDVAEVRQRDAAERTQRARELRQRLAAARARAASSGTGAGAGSARAVRRGIEDELMEEDALAVEERDLAIRNIRARAGAKKRRNLLDSRSRTTKDVVGGAMKVGTSLLDF
jgi:ribosomal protein L29